MTWRPLVTDELLKENILKKLNEFSGIISAEHKNCTQPGLMNGQAGMSIFFSYLDKLQDKTENDAVINELVSSSFNAINNGFELPTYCIGLSGILWAFHHLNSEELVEADYYFEELIRFAERKMFEFADEKNLDYLHGAVGIGLYLLHNSDKVGRATFDKLVDGIAAQGILENETIKWTSKVSITSGKSCYNLSLSHGISATIIFISMLLEKYPEHKQAKELLTKSVNYLLSQKNKEPCISLFPAYVENTATNPVSRLSWCYGDLGNAIALLKAGDVLNDTKITNEAIAIIQHACKRRDLVENKVVDTAFCHGTAGIAHIFNRFYQQTGLEECRETALYWIEKTMEMAVHEDGYAGHKTHKGVNLSWEKELAILDGISGIGLVLIGAVSDFEPRWDRCFLLS